jgi:hypothetical protein
VKCLDCDVLWSEFDPSGTGRRCWNCGKEIPKPEPKPVHRAYVFPDSPKVRTGERG